MLRGVDLHQVLVQTEQVEKVQQVHQQHPDRQQRYIDLQLKEEKRLLKEKVKDAEEAGKAQLRDKKDGSSERQAGDGREEGAPQVYKEEGDQQPLEEGRLIDIKV